ncbi:23S rRNA (adenine(2503)-C(2))-methyltransferase RlmN [Youxingia wuxianensis]|uniref:Probable dual-specificity RNA methyltransferase RlmN n=1 Tax=Youxingia wuxianensis TaxID=2763678 RepID=A0A926EN87_9FIRM|nr:23S rRNA (adenine(2503)-C(2))-methyltransferase RlmN [Youxingia wuxianensis]MBC8585716.1 23S rRNA (adenine(2503)-C(2))-methyltransferase RlmN [Youxingia wuxianensis]
MEATQNKQDIKSFTLEELTALTAQFSLPKFRAKQIYSWLHEKRVGSFHEMSNLPADLRRLLDEKFYINAIHIKKRLVSAIDGTVKYLYELMDGNCVEAVLMKYKHGNSLCISTQVGCRMGCKFCASTIGGLVRGLTPSEMLDEVYTAQADSGERVSSIVLMGIGEPLDNFDNVLCFLNILSSQEGLNLSLRHVSLSTCGLADKIDELAQKKLQLTLSVSLHAPNDQIRDRSMPINKRYNMDRLLQACRNYFDITGRRISFEYALIDGVNDSPQNARELARRLRGMGAHVNLIPVNSVDETGYQRSSREAIDRFKEQLEKLGVNVTVRRELGVDISAACGQLRRQSQKEELA